MLDSIIVHTDSLYKTVYWTGAVWMASLLVLAVVFTIVWARDPAKTLSFGEGMDGEVIFGLFFIVCAAIAVWPLLAVAAGFTVIVAGPRYVVQAGRDHWDHRSEEKSKSKDQRMEELEARSDKAERSAEQLQKELDRLLAEDSDHSATAPQSPTAIRPTTEREHSLYSD